jgi:hypothetical protein
MVMSGDSASVLYAFSFRVVCTCSPSFSGATIAVNVMIKILESLSGLPHPLALVLNYATLDFNFASWMSPGDLRVLQSEQSSANLRGLAEAKDHLSHVSPLSMVGPNKMRRRRSWRETIRHPFGSTSSEVPPARVRRSKTRPEIRRRETGDHERASFADSEDEPVREPRPSRTLIQTGDRPVQSRVRFVPLSQSTLEKQQKETPRAPHTEVPSTGEPLGTRMTMTSRSGYFQDRIITPSMVRDGFTIIAQLRIGELNLPVLDACVCTADACDGITLYWSLPQPGLRD